MFSKNIKLSGSCLRLIDFKISIQCTSTKVTLRRYIQSQQYKFYFNKLECEYDAKSTLVKFMIYRRQFSSISNDQSLDYELLLKKVEILEDLDHKTIRIEDKLIERQNLQKLLEMNMLLSLSSENRVKTQYLLARLLILSEHFRKNLPMKSFSPSTNAQGVMNEIKMIQKSVIRTRSSKKGSRKDIQDENSGITDRENDNHDFTMATQMLRNLVSEVHVPSMCLLADILIKNNDAASFREALSLYDKIASVSNGEIRANALRKLGEIYYEGNDEFGLKADHQKSFKYFLIATQPNLIISKSSKNNLPIDISDYLLHEIPTLALEPTSINSDIDIEEVLKCLESETSPNRSEMSTDIAFDLSGKLNDFDLVSCYYVGHCFATGENGCDIIVPALAYKFLSIASYLGHPKASYHLAALFRSGLESSNQISSTQSDYFKNFSQDVIEANHKLFKYYLTKSLIENDEDALFCYGDIKYNGFEGISEIDTEPDNVKFFSTNTKQAITLFAKASSLGHVPSMLNLAAIYYNGFNGVMPDKMKAFEIYNLAAEKGSEDAWMNLASMYYLGDGVEKSEDIARQIMKAMAKSSPFQVWLGNSIFGKLSSFNEGDQVTLQCLISSSKCDYSTIVLHSAVDSNGSFQFSLSPCDWNSSIFKIIVKNVFHGTRYTEIIGTSNDVSGMLFMSIQIPPTYNSAKYFYNHNGSHYNTKSSYFGLSLRESTYIFVFSLILCITHVIFFWPRRVRRVATYEWRLCKKRIKYKRPQDTDSEFMKLLLNDSSSFYNK